jgi:hypothetical protein
MKVKFILPALTEATSPFWRPIKYSLFPPLGLATLAGYLDAEDEAMIQDEHVERLTLDDHPARQFRRITSAYRAYEIADRYRAQGTCCDGWSSSSLPDKLRDMPIHFSWTWRSFFHISKDLRGQPTECV